MAIGVDAKSSFIRDARKRLTWFSENYSVYLDYRLQKDAALHREQSWLSENCSTRIQIKNRKCGIVIKQAAEELTLPGAIAAKQIRPPE